MNNKYKLLLKDTLIFALGNLGSKLILFFLVPLYTNYLTTEQYGTADLVFTFSQLIIPVTSVVINEAVIRFALMRNEKPENVLLAAYLVLGISVVTSLIFVPLIGLYDAVEPWRWYLFAVVILSNISEVQKAFLKATNKNRQFAFISILQTGVLATSNIILLAAFHMGVAGYLLSNIIALFISVIASFFLGIVYSNLRKARIDFVLIKRMVLFSSPLILNNISWWVIHSSDKIMIEVMIGLSELGIYTAATKIPSLINVIISVFTQAWGLSTIREVESENDYHFFSSVFESYSFITFGAGIAIISIIKPFMHAYVGDAFRDAYLYTSLLLTAAVFYSISSYFGSIYSAIQKTTHSMFTTILCAISNIILNYILIQIVGIWGAVIGTLGSYFIIAHIRMFDIVRMLRLHINIRKYLLNVCLLLTQSILVSIGWHPALTSTIAVTIFVAVNIKLIFKLLKSFPIKDRKG